jgi:hypothetical protein
VLVPRVQLVVAILSVLSLPLQAVSNKKANSNNVMYRRVLMQNSPAASCANVFDFIDSVKAYSCRLRNSDREILLCC